MIMRFIPLIVLVSCFFSLPNASVLAYLAVPHSAAVPYEIVPLVNDSERAQIVFGKLDGYPEMVEFAVTSTTTVMFGLRGIPRDDAPVTELSGILIKVEEPRGVSEIIRLEPGEASWQTLRDDVSRLPYYQGPVAEATLGVGTYRFEVSTPDGYGEYLLTIGDVSRGSGLMTTWQSVQTLYDFYGVSKLGMLLTSLLFYPIGIVLILSGIGLTVYKTRNRWRTQS
jgi:hypothetical protein